jgi:hypothetical protein
MTRTHARTTTIVLLVVAMLAIAAPASAGKSAVSGWGFRRLARALRTTHPHAFGLTASLGVVLLVTLSPSPDAGSADMLRRWLRQLRSSK